MTNKKTILTKSAIALLGITSLLVTADLAHAETIDLKGYDAKVGTSRGKNYIATKKGNWALDSSTVLQSSKNQKIELNNTVPVTINSIKVGKTLEVTGNGELTANNPNGEFGIDVGQHIKAFKGSKSGSGKIVGKGKTVGVRVYNEVQMDAGTLEAEGQTYGLWSYNDIKPHKDAVISAVAKADNGIGIWAYRDIYAYDGAQVLGTGGASGGYSEIAHIESRGEGSLISGTSNNINSKYSALHAQKQMLRAFTGGTVREVYNNPGFEITKDKPINVVSNYKNVARNMSDMQTYDWSSEPAGVYNTDAGLLGNLKEPFREGMIIGERVDEGKKKSKVELTELKKNGTHQVMFGNVKASYTMPVKLVHLFDNYSDVIRVEEIIDVEIGQTFVVGDHVYDISFTEGDYLGVDKEDFVIDENNEDGYTVTYKYEGDFNENHFK